MGGGGGVSERDGTWWGRTRGKGLSPYQLHKRCVMSQLQIGSGFYRKDYSFQNAARVVVVVEDVFNGTWSMGLNTNVRVSIELI